MYKTTGLGKTKAEKAAARAAKAVAAAETAVAKAVSLQPEGSLPIGVAQPSHYEKGEPSALRTWGPRVLMMAAGLGVYWYFRRRRKLKGRV
jgi:hypothetical protein